MKTLYLFTFYLVLSIFFGCSSEQDKDTYNPMSWKVGQWVLYVINGEERKYSIIGQDSSYFWLETSSKDAVVQTLIKENMEGEARGLIVKKGESKPIEFPSGEFSLTPTLPLAVKDKTFIGIEELVLPCGRFRCFYAKHKEGDIWLSDKIPIFGIVKYTDERTQMILKDFGLEGAVSSLKEKPLRPNYLSLKALQER